LEHSKTIDTVATNGASLSSSMNLPVSALPACVDGNRFYCTKFKQLSVIPTSFWVYLPCVSHESSHIPLSVNCIMLVTSASGMSHAMYLHGIAGEDVSECKDGQQTYNAKTLTSKLPINRGVVVDQTLGRERVQHLLTLFAPDPQTWHSHSSPCSISKYTTCISNQITFPVNLKHYMGCTNMFSIQLAHRYRHHTYLVLSFEAAERTLVLDVNGAKVAQAVIPGMVTNEATILACTGKSMYVLQVTHKSILLIKPVYNDCAQQWKPSTLGHESSPSHMEITHASSATGGTDGGGVLGAAVHQGYIYSVHILLWGSSGIRHIGELEIKNKVTSIGVCYSKAKCHPDIDTFIAVCVWKHIPNVLILCIASKDVERRRLQLIQSLNIQHGPARSIILLDDQKAALVCNAELVTLNMVIGSSDGHVAYYKLKIIHTKHSDMDVKVLCTQSCSIGATEVMLSHIHHMDDSDVCNCTHIFIFSSSNHPYMMSFISSSSEHLVPHTLGEVTCNRHQSTHSSFHLSRLAGNLLGMQAAIPLKLGFFPKSCTALACISSRGRLSLQLLGEISRVETNGLKTCTAQIRLSCLRRFIHGGKPISMVCNASKQYIIVLMQGRSLMCPSRVALFDLESLNCMLHAAVHTHIPISLSPSLVFYPVELKFHVDKHAHVNVTFFFA